MLWTYIIRFRKTQQYTVIANCTFRKLLNIIAFCCFGLIYIKRCFYTTVIRVYATADVYADVSAMFDDRTTVTSPNSAGSAVYWTVR